MPNEKIETIVDKASEKIINKIAQAGLVNPIFPEEAEEALNKAKDMKINNNIEKIKNFYQNIDYIITGTEDGWLDIKNPNLVQLCYDIKELSEHTYDELFKFEEKPRKAIKLK